jgi:hypothetical protein
MLACYTLFSYTKSMQKKLVALFLMLFSIAAVLYPVCVWYQGVKGTPVTPAMLFPVFGLIAFATMWLHVVGASVQSWLEKYVSFENFVNRTAYIVLISIILHPLLLFTAMGFKNLGVVIVSPYILLAIAGWLLLLTYDIGKIFKRRQFFIRHWHAIKIVSTIGFFLIFFHSLALGSNLQSGPLRAVWILYGMSAAIAAIYTYAIKRRS